MSSVEDRPVASPVAVAPTPREWESLCAPDAHRDASLVDVIIPVYTGYDQTLRCIYSALASKQATPFNVLVVNDCSPDPALSGSLRNLAGDGLIELHELPTNLGFVGACNFGMTLHPERDVLLLNSDTEVHNDWLDRLRATACRGDRTATVTPLSNNATICSYPRFVENNIVPLELADAELDALAARVNAGVEVDIPTGVGFCMYIRRACLDELGLFDVEAFGRGYGEENDLCCRARARGWRNVLAADVFVRHYGGVSFGSMKPERELKAVATVERRHPGYLRLVQRFIADDPVRPYRERLDCARLRCRAQPGSILFVLHAWGGGTEHHVDDLRELLARQGVSSLVCKVDPQLSSRVWIADPSVPETPNLCFDVLRDIDRFLDAVRALHIRHIHLHSLAGYVPEASDFFQKVCEKAQVRYDVTVHDYMAACPRINLIDRSGLYCGEPDLGSCEHCIATDSSPFGKPSVWHWRDRYARLFGGARKVFVPDPDVQRRMERFFPGVEFELRRHPELRSVTLMRRRATARRSAPSVRIALLGALGPHKGSALLEQVATAARQQGSPVSFVVVGYTDRDDRLRQLGVEITGRYPREEGPRRLAMANADFVWLSSVWPETYAYTLSVAFIARVYPVAFDMGALGTRIREACWGLLLPLDLMLDPAALARTLVEVRPRAASAAFPGGVQTYAEGDFLQSYYQLSVLQSAA